MKAHYLSVIVPARDEEKNIFPLVKLLPDFRVKTEIIFIEGHSSDHTWEHISKVKRQNSKLKGKSLKVLAYRQKGRGKADAVRLGFSKATGDILMILDADLSVQPKELIAFYNLLASGKADFVNGSRFVYAQEKGAMRYFNHLGNKFFALVFSLILRQRITDTLCGTKALFRKDYLRIAKATELFSKSDPYGDFQLLLGARILGLRIKEIPVRYKARVYGKSKISPLRDGIRLIILLFRVPKTLIFSRKNKS